MKNLILILLAVVSMSARTPDINAHSQSIGVFKSLQVSGSDVTAATIGQWNTAYSSLSSKMNYGDTTALSNRINLKLNKSDTSSLSSRIGLKMNYTDTSGLSNRIVLKMSYTDTLGLSGRINNKMNYIDTIGLSGRINIKMGYADTIGLSARIGQKLNTIDAMTASSTNTLTNKSGNVSQWANDAGYITASYIPTLNAATRPINSTTYTISTTKQAAISYNISISCTATIGGASSGQVEFQYSTNAGSTWIPAGLVKNSNTVSLAIALNSITVQVASISLTGIPVNALCRMVSVSSGTTTIAYNYGFETY